MTPSAADESGFPADTLAQLATKPHLMPTPRHGMRQINVLTLGLRDGAARFFTACAMMADARGPSVHRRVWQCGDVRVEDLSATGDANALRVDAALAEEVGIVARGERARFGAEMRPSGWYSRNVLGRRYGRDATAFTTRPHAVFVAHGDGRYPHDAALLSQLVDAALTRHATERCEAETEAVVRLVGAPGDARAAADDVEDLIIRRHMRACVAEQTNARVAEALGERRAQTDADAANATVAAAAAAATVVMQMAARASRPDATPAPAPPTQAPAHAATLRRATECEATLREVMRKLDAAQAEKKRAVSEAFESGVRNAKEVA